MANRGDVRPFVRFIAECTERTLDLFIWATTEYAHEFPALETYRDSSRTIFVDDSVTQTQEDNVGTSSPSDVNTFTCSSPSSDCDGFE